MRTQVKMEAKTPVHSRSAPAGSMFQTRPFGAQTDSHESSSFDGDTLSLFEIYLQRRERDAAYEANRAATPSVPSTSPIVQPKLTNPVRITGGTVNQAIKRAGLRQENNTGLPDHLKTGLETLSGMAMDDVKVHYNSPKPAQLQALAYAQGTNIHVAPGQERHLPHEAWHVVQQKQGRVRPTMQMKGVGINHDQGLEREADVMGAKALQRMPQHNQSTRDFPPQRHPSLSRALQLKCINDDYKDLKLVKETDKTITLKGQIGRGTENILYPMKLYEIDIGESSSKAEAFKKETQKIQSMGKEVGSNKLAKTIKQVKNNAEWTDNNGQGWVPEPKDNYWPFELMLKTTYKSNESNESNESNDVSRELTFQFASDKYGYLVQITDNKQTYNMKELKDNEDLAEAEFSSKHEVDRNRNIYNQALEGKSPLDIDDQTKVIAEGARWCAVSEFAKNNQLKDGTEFYPAKNNEGNDWNDDDDVPYVTFDKLWTQWNKFKQQWGISNMELKEKIINNNRLRTGTKKWKDIRDDNRYFLTSDRCIIGHNPN